MKLSEMRELVSKATPGPWKSFHRLPDHECPTSWEVGVTPADIWEYDAKLIAAMRNNIEKLLDVAEQVKKCLDLYEIKGNAWKKLSEKIEELERE